jgi:pyruvate kinase
MPPWLAFASACRCPEPLEIERLRTLQLSSTTTIELLPLYHPFNMSSSSVSLPSLPNMTVSVSSSQLSDPNVHLISGTPPRSSSLFSPTPFASYQFSAAPTVATPTSSSQANHNTQYIFAAANARAVDNNPNLPPRCKIICTVGPSCQAKEKMKALVLAGMNVIRCNFSHGDHDYHRTTIQNIRDVCAESRRVVAILLDTKGPEIRTGKLIDNKDIELKQEQELILTTDESHIGDNKKIAVFYKNLPNKVVAGNHILIDDGLIDTIVQETGSDYVKVKVVNTGILGNTKGVNLPGISVDLPAVTPKDISDIQFGLQQGIDFIAASFVRKAQDVKDIRNILGTKGANIKIISKIESQEGLDNFDSILEVSDGIMVARGDLGVEIPIEQVALAQKMIIRKCNIAGKPVITATQMLESMVKNPSPTRAEAGDVANAVLDGTDCVMLSGETAKGLYPLEAVRIMADICREAEANLSHATMSQMLREEVRGEKVSIVEAIASSAVRASFELRASVIICLTETGTTSRLVSKYRPSAPILTVTSSEQTARQSLISRGLFPLLVGSMVGHDSLINRVLSAAQRLGICRSNDLAIVTSGNKEAEAGATNDLKIIQVA